MERKWWTLLAVCLGTFMLLVDVTIVNVALPSIQDDLHASFAQLQWVVDAYALSLAALLLTAGSLADMFGRRRLFAIGLAVFTAGSLLCALATGPVFLVLARAGQGIGGAIMFATSLALLAQAFRGRDRGTAFAVWGAVTGVAVAIGPVLGGIITTGWSWRGIFFVNIPVGVAAMIVTISRVAESRDPGRGGVDLAGFALFTSALIALVYGLIRAGEQGWGDAGVAACLASAAVLLAGFVAAERFGRAPMFDLALFRVPAFAGGSLAAFAVNGCVYAMLLYIVLYLQDVLGYSALQTGLRLLIMSAVTLPAAIASGRLTNRVPVRLLIGAGLALSGAGAAGHVRPAPGLGLDPPDSRADPGRRRVRPGQPGAGGHRGGRGPAPVGRDGLGHQHHVPPGRRGHRDRGVRHPVRRQGGAPPPRAGSPGRVRQRPERDPRGQRHRRPAGRPRRARPDPHP